MSVLERRSADQMLVSSEHAALMPSDSKGRTRDANSGIAVERSGNKRSGRSC